MTREEAEKLVEADLNGPGNDSGVEFVLLRDHTVEKSYGWIFFFQSREFVETGNELAMVAGNGPVAFLSSDSSIHYLGSADPIEETIERFEAETRLGM